MSKGREETLDPGIWRRVIGGTTIPTHIALHGSNVVGATALAATAPKDKEIYCLLKHQVG